MPDAPPATIAVLRANAIGDFVYTLPALDALRARFPDAEIVLLGRPWHRDFLAGRPSPVDRVVALPPIAGVGAPEDFPTDPAVLAACVDALRRERVDLAVQLHGGGRHSNRFLRSIGAACTIGLRTADALPLDRTVSYQYWQPEILRLLEVVALAGAAPVTLAPRLAVTPGDVAEARAAAPGDRTRLVAIHPGAGDPRRRWPIAHFGRLVRALLAGGFRVVVVGDATDDRRLASELVALAGGEGDIADATGRLSLGGLAGLASECRLFCGNDSGPLHIAEAAGAPTVGIYWCGNSINADPMTRDRHRAVLSWRLDCAVCGANVLDTRCGHAASFVDLAPADEAIAQAFDLLGVATGSTVAFRNGMK